MQIILHNTLVKYSLVIISGILYTTSFEPMNLKIMAYLSLFIFIYIASNNDRKSSIKLSVLFGFTIFLFGASWVFDSLYNYGGGYLFLSLLMTFLFIIIISALFVPIGFIINKKVKERSHVLFPFLVSSIWVICELIRSNIFGGFPWLLLGTSQSETFMNILFPLLGTYFISFLIIFIVASLVTFIHNNRNSYILLNLIFPLLAIVFLNILNIKFISSSVSPIRISIIQPNISQLLKFDKEYIGQIKEKYVSLIKSVQNVDLIIFPETVIPRIYNDDKEFYSSLRSILSNNTSLLTGIFRSNPQRTDIYNSLVLFDEYEQFYDKRHLVPFGEYVPLKPIFNFFAKILNIPMSNISEGSESQKHITLSGISLYPLICYEIAYPSLINLRDDSPGFIVTISNDAWFGDTSAPSQHLQIAQTRALETSHYVLRSANTGISAIIDPSGTIIKKINLNQSGVLQSEVFPSKGKTPYMVFGDYPVLMLIFIIMFIHFRQIYKYGF